MELARNMLLLPLFRLDIRHRISVRLLLVALHLCSHATMALVLHHQLNAPSAHCVLLLRRTSAHQAVLPVRPPATPIVLRLLVSVLPHLRMYVRMVCVLQLRHCAPQDRAWEPRLARRAERLLSMVALLLQVAALQDQRKLLQMLGQ